MKNVCSVLAMLITLTSFAASDAQIVGVVFSDQKFLAAMGNTKVEEIEVSVVSNLKHSIVVNSRAPMVDGCSYSAAVTETKERFAINPLTTGLRSVLKVTRAKANCPRRNF